MSSADGTAEVYGVLLDMAEIWELYLYHLIRDGLPEVEVLHTGRSPDAVFWLLNGRGTDHIGAMKPDILVSSRRPLSNGGLPERRLCPFKFTRRWTALSSVYACGLPSAEKPFSHRSQWCKVLFLRNWLRPITPCRCVHTGWNGICIWASEARYCWELICGNCSPSSETKI